MSNRNRIAGALALTALLCAAAAAAGARRNAQPAEIPAAVLTLAATSVSNQIDCRGRLEYGVEYDISVSRPSRVLSVQTLVGNRVERGEPLMVLEPAFDAGSSGTADLQEELISAFSGLLGSGAEHGRPAVIPLNANGRQTLYSPAAGLITQVSASPSQTVPAGRTLLTLSDPESLQVRAAIPEVYVQDLSAGLDCRIRGEAFRDREYRGTISRIMPNAYQNGTLGTAGDTVVDVLVAIEEPDDALRAGFTAQLEIHTPLREGMLLVPYEAVMQDENDTEYVYLVKNGRALRRDIVTGLELQDRVEIVSGCEAGERVILEPAGIRENDRIRTAEVAP